MLFLETETAKQNQKISFPFLFPLRGGGVGGRRREKNARKFFWLLHTRVRERVRGALVRFTRQSERTIWVKATTRSARANQSKSCGFFPKYIRTSSNTHR